MSLVLNVAVVAGLVHLAFPRVLDGPEPQSIVVEIVPEEPKRVAAPPAKQAPAPVQAAAESEKSAPSRQTPAADENVAKPAAETPRPPPTPAVQDDRAAQPAKPAEAAAAPAPIEGDRNPAPRLVAAPSAPKAAETQAVKNVAANAETKPADAPRSAERRSPPAPDVLASSGATADAVPQPNSAAPTPQPAPEPSADEKRQAENTARLAAALPFAQNVPPTFARAAQSGTGDGVEQRYRGDVYSQFHKADALIEQAQAAHLRGQTVVEFAVDDTGALTAVRVAVSSGNPEVDRIAEDIIRRSAPFPPPPPGAQHVFSPAIRLGLDD